MYKSRRDLIKAFSIEFLKKYQSFIPQMINDNNDDATVCLDVRTFLLVAPGFEILNYCSCSVFCIGVKFIFALSRWQVLCSWCVSPCDGSCFHWKWGVDATAFSGLTATRPQNVSKATTRENETYVSSESLPNPL